MHVSSVQGCLSGQPRYSIVQSLHGIELQPLLSQPIVAGLICHCSHFQAALRIARKAAQLRQQPLIIGVQCLHQLEAVPISASRSSTSI